VRTAHVRGAARIAVAASRFVRVAAAADRASECGLCAAVSDGVQVTAFTPDWEILDSALQNRKNSRTLT
jgi:hypothetical protein